MSRSNKRNQTYQTKPEKKKPNKNQIPQTSDYSAWDGTALDANYDWKAELASQKKSTTPAEISMPSNTVMLKSAEPTGSYPEEPKQDISTAKPADTTAPKADISTEFTPAPEKAKSRFLPILTKFFSIYITHLILIIFLASTINISPFYLAANPFFHIAIIISDLAVYSKISI